MIEASWLLFAAASLLLILTPGQVYRSSGAVLAGLGIELAFART